MIPLIKKYKRHLPAIALVSGLVWDMLTLGRPDQLYGNLVLLSYIFIAGFCIALMTRREYLAKKPSIWIQLLTQFSFGNLTGGLLVLYIGSATLVGNWPFLLILVLLLVGNEIFRSRHAQLRFNTAVYYFLALLYLILLVPVLTRSIEQWTFILSSVLSIIFISSFLYLVRIIAKDVFYRNKKILTRSILGILVVFGVLYYSNLIPPVPLAVRDIGIFHNIERVGNDYFVTYEKGKWYEFWRDSDTRIYLGMQNTASCFSAIFAPTDLKTPVYHIWEAYNENTDTWEERGRFDFPIFGGRVLGYRGYSEKTVTEGRWRCSVETERGALLGRIYVDVITGSPKEYTTEIR